MLELHHLLQNRASIDLLLPILSNQNMSHQLDSHIDGPLGYDGGQSLLSITLGVDDLGVKLRASQLVSSDLIVSVDCGHLPISHFKAKGNVRAVLHLAQRVGVRTTFDVQGVPHVWSQQEVVWRQNEAREHL